VSSVRRVAGNLFSLFSGEAISSALAFVITILLARRLSDEGFGRLALVQSVMVYLTLFMDMGLGTFGAREIARYPDRLGAYAGSIFSLRLLLSLIVAVPFAAAVAFWPMPAEMRWLCWGSALGLFTQALNPEFAFQGSERMSGIAAWRVLVHAFYLLLIFVLVAGRGQLWAVPFLRFAAEAFTLLLLGTWLFRSRGQVPAFTWQPGIWRGYLRESLVMAASVVVIKLYYTFDTIMLGIMDKPEAVGWYQAAYKVVLLFNGATVLVQVAFAPYFARFWQDPGQMVKVMTRYAIILVYLGSIASLPLILLHEELIGMIYGTGYAGAANILSLLSISLYGVFLYSIFLGPLLYSGRQKKYLLFLSIAAGLNILFNLLLIPAFSLIGAATAVILSSICLLVIVAVDYVREYREVGLVFLIGKMVLLALLLASIFHYCVLNNWLASIFFVISFSIVAYLLNRQTIQAIIDTFFSKNAAQHLSDQELK
jgi:O-antigen/teichoic acid export membrane protein